MRSQTVMVFQQANRNQFLSPLRKLGGEKEFVGSQVVELGKGGSQSAMEQSREKKSRGCFSRRAVRRAVARTGRKAATEY